MVDSELHRLIDNNHAVLIARKSGGKYMVVSTLNGITFHDDSIVSGGKNLRRALARHADKVFRVGEFSKDRNNG